MFMTNSSDIGLLCDVCGRIVQEIKFFNSKKVCLKCYKEINKKAINTKIEDAYFALLDEYKIIKEENYLLKLFIKQKDPDLVAIRVEDKTIELPIVEPIGSGMGYTIKKQRGRSKI